MAPKPRTVKEINQRIIDGSVQIVAADKMARLVKDYGPEEAMEKVDVVTTGTFGAMCSSGAWLNVGHSDPPIKIEKAYLNDVEANTGNAAVDIYIGATKPSRSKGFMYGGGHVIEDLLKGETVILEAQGFGTDCYPKRTLRTEISLEHLNQAIMVNPRNSYERYNVATNTTERTLYTYMGKLLPNLGNATFSGAGELSPIANDPTYQTIGIGTRILLGGSEGYVIGSGTQHNPETGFGTLMVKGDLKGMSPDFIRGSTFSGYGCTLFVGLGIPIPVLNQDIARSTGVSDSELVTNVLDYGVRTRDRPVLERVNYSQLKGGRIEVSGNDVKCASISSLPIALKIAKKLRNLLEKGEFFLSEPVDRIPLIGLSRPLSTAIQKKSRFPTPKPQPDKHVIKKDENCIHCGLCISYCPNDVFYLHEGEVKTNPENCILCRKCENVCPHGCIVV